MRCSSRGRRGCASYLGGMLKELIDGLQVSVAGRVLGESGASSPKLPKLPDSASCARWSSARAAASCCG